MTAAPEGHIEELGGLSEVNSATEGDPGGFQTFIRGTAAVPDRHGAARR